MSTQGRFIVITGPSAAGKTRLVDELLQRVPNAARLVTVTTRAARPGEKDGVDYFFISRGEFRKRLAENDFFEHAEVYGNLYGSSKRVLISFLERYQFVFAIVDVQGADALKRFIPDCTVLFLRPGSIGEIERRLKSRAMAVPSAEMKRRVLQAKQELSRADDFDGVIENREGEFDATIEQALAALGLSTHS